MKKIALLISVLTILGFVVFGAGCVGTDPVVGTYSSNLLGGMMSLTMTFYEDGTGYADMGSSFNSKVEKKSFTWINTGDSTYRISSEGKNEYCYLSPDKNTITGVSDGITLMLTRIK